MLSSHSELFSGDTVWLILLSTRAVAGAHREPIFSLCPLRFMDRLGYYVSPYSFRGPFLPVQDIRAGRPVTISGGTLFCVKKDMYDALEADRNRDADRRLA